MEYSVVTTHLDDAVFIITDRTPLCGFKGLKSLINAVAASTESFLNRDLLIHPSELAQRLETFTSAKVILKIEKGDADLTWQVFELE